jgi:hypothetical protein
MYSVYRNRAVAAALCVPTANKVFKLTRYQPRLLCPFRCAAFYTKAASGSGQLNTALAHKNVLIIQYF